MSLTKKGHALVARALPLWRKAQDAVESALADQPWPSVLRGMQIAADLHDLEAFERRVAPIARGSFRMIDASDESKKRGTDRAVVARALASVATGEA